MNTFSSGRLRQNHSRKTARFARVFLPQSTTDGLPAGQSIRILAKDDTYVASVQVVIEDANGNI